MDGRIRYEYAVITKRVDADIFVSGKKKLRIQKYPDTCGRGLNLQTCFVCSSKEEASNVEHMRLKHVKNEANLKQNWFVYISDTWNIISVNLK